MPVDDEDQGDADVPLQAVRGLNEATQRALKSGRPAVLVRDRQLIQVSAEGTIVLKQLPPRQKVIERQLVLKP